MPMWKGDRVETIEETKEYWRNQDPEMLDGIMHVSEKKQIAWLKVATGIATKSGALLEPGCGDGLMAKSLPEGQNLQYFGVDINPGFIDRARKNHPEGIFACGDLYEFLDEVTAENFDWVVVSNLFGMFPLEETYQLIEKLWTRAEWGFSMTTLNWYKYHNPRARKNQLTSHKPEELLEVLKSLPGVGEIRMNSDMKDGNMNRKFAVYAYRDMYDGRIASPEYKGVSK